MTDPAPLDAPAFDALMRTVGPFERRPRLGLGLSGGADSRALALLLVRWAEPIGAEVLAFTVDHGLRPEASEEAARAGAFATSLGLTHRTLTGPLPDGNTQQAARALRRDLLAEACRAAGALHLALAHHRDDQAETVILRLARGSGVDGLAAMAPVTEWPEIRVVRPLLSVPAEVLRATLSAFDHGWDEDPSNRNRRFRRVRVRQALDEGGGDARETSARLARTAAGLRRARAALESEAASLLARGALVAPGGYVVLRADALAAAPDEIGLRALSRVLAGVGGLDHPPRERTVAALLADLVSDGPARARTAGRCRVLRWSGPTGDRVLVCREPRFLAPPMRLGALGPNRWDGRFVVSPMLANRPGRTLQIGALGPGGWARLEPTPAALVPRAARAALPALIHHGTVVAVPHANYRHPELDPGMILPSPIFLPPRPLS